MRLRGFFLALLGGTLMMATTALAAEGGSVTWDDATYTDASGGMTEYVSTTSPPDGYVGYLALPAVAVQNDVLLAGSYAPPNAVVTINVYIVKQGGGSLKHTPTIPAPGSWNLTVPKGDLAAAAVYDVKVRATINGKNLSPDYQLNIGNP